MTGKSDRASLLSPAFVRVTLANFCFFMTFATFFLLPLQVRALGGSERTVGFVMGMNGIAGLVSVFALGAVLDRWGRLLFLRLGLVVMLLATLGYTCSACASTPQRCCPKTMRRTASTTSRAC